LKTKNKRIPTYVINLSSRKDRLIHIKSQFLNKEEFRVNIVEGIKNDVGALGLWKTMLKVLKLAQESDHDYILICEDDHQFTEHYSKEVLFDRVSEAKAINADVLLGGVSTFSSVFHMNSNLLWIERFSGNQFLIIFKQFYKVLLKTSFSILDHSDFKISDLSNRKFVIHPFISTQKEVGRSDISDENSIKGEVESLFERSQKSLYDIDTIRDFYLGFGKKEVCQGIDFKNIMLSTYIINFSEHLDRLAPMKEQFKNRTEFDIKIIRVSKNSRGANRFWNGIQLAVKDALINDDDVIIICSDTHEFTNSYESKNFLKNVIESHAEQADFLFGGTYCFGRVLPITENRYWVNSCLSTQFVVVYNKIFQAILDLDLDETDLVDTKLSELSANKMILYPYISEEANTQYCQGLKAKDAELLKGNMLEQAVSSFERIRDSYRDCGQTSSNFSGRI
jgi:hypothetical protein